MTIEQSRRGAGWSRRGLLTGGAGLALAACHPSASGADANLKDVALRVWRYKGSAAYFMDAAGVGHFPYKVEFADFPGGSLVLNAFSAGALDYAHMSQVPPIFAAVRGVPLRFIAAHLGDVNSSGLLIQKDSPIKSVADLRGKRVCYVPATNNHYELIKILEVHGLSFKDITPVALTVPDGMAAFSRGHIDAIVGAGVTALLAIEQWGARWLVNSVAGYYSGNFLIAANPAAIENPGKSAAIADYLHREKVTWDWINNNRDEWSAISARTTDAPERLFKQLYDHRSRKDQLAIVTPDIVQDQQQVADELLKVGAIDRRVDVTPFWTKQYNSVLS